jgi:hypothetical protein
LGVGNADGTWEYDEDTVLQVLGRDEPLAGVVTTRPASPGRSGAARWRG